ncbi:MAG TPA: TM0106 family RecB-like putative nuclease [Chitinophagaceae bacterium]|nr:TM0106 family RecB-like putative nuclease [Chitinophagaceae bacterium]
MKIIDTTIYLSASDLSTHMSCKHATFLNLQLARKLISPPHVYDNPSLLALQQRGEDFEKNYISHLKASGKTVVEISKGNTNEAAGQTLDAMRNGVDIIYQARLELGAWNGWADFLIKRGDRASTFGDWSYEVMDTKLSKETRPGAILQISLYSEMLEQVQRSKPEFMYIKNPAGEHKYRIDDFAAHYRLMKKDLLQSINHPQERYPDPVPHCDICKWWTVCNKRRRDDDHLSFIAGMGNMQMNEVRKWGVTTLELMAELTLPLIHKPERGNVQIFEKLSHQARLQHQWRTINRPVFELLPLQEDVGLYKLPEPSEHDIFFDFEGDPYAGDTGIEYLFGWYYRDDYYDLWAHNDAEELKALNKFMDTVMDIWKQDDKMHIYHFGAYEQSALKRLVGKYAAREDELDRLLRAGVFVNLHVITRHSVRAGVESYSLKDLEKLHGYLRIRDLRLVAQKKVLYEGLLESGYFDTIDDETIAVVKDYNKDDCISTKHLRDWLEKLRQQLVDEKKDIPRPAKEDENPSENITAHQQRIQPLFDELTKGVSFEKKERDSEQQAKWLLANMLDWYRREEKSLWWEHYRLKEMADDELLEEKTAISMLKYTGKREPIAKSVIDYYQFPGQETEIDIGDKVKYKGDHIGTIVSLDNTRCILGLKRGMKLKDIHPAHVVHLEIIKSTEKEESIIRFAQYVIQNGLTAPGRYQAGRELLLRSIKLPIDPLQIVEGSTPSIVQVTHLENDVLPIQGPPGTGKSHTAAQMIVSLIRAGKKIGITALGHKVITELLKKVNAAAVTEKLNVRIVQKVRELTNRNDPKWIETVDDNKLVLECIQQGFHIAAGTSFMWARQEFFESVDFLFVDEAGQLSLIDTLALSHAGKNLVLMGDPQQLKQPQKGSHPAGTEVSALEHILQEKKTISEDQGLFLETTWRMHPAINAYISELFYDNRLHPKAETMNQRLEGSPFYPEPGLYVELVPHQGNQNSSVEEVEKVVSIVNSLLGGNVCWIDSNNQRHKMTFDHIKIISPYNAQVEKLKSILPGIQIGTVDKFQGQEAPVIIFSMATSTPEDAPRGMEFLYSLNRFNVAVSRARAIFILVVSPSLFDPSCKSTQQMQLANSLCRLKEMAKTNQ